MNIVSHIESAEHRFKQILEEFFISVYNEKSLPSHGIEHHRRVWGYARELVISIENHNISIDPDLPENLIIACYLHDIGMSVDHGIKHGHHSKELCIEFLRKNHLEENSYKNLLSAIENHDNKEYRTSAQKYDLLTILSVADDMDAFGFIGIYRYSEIYLARGISLKEIGSLILRNAGKRFDNFKRTFGDADSIVLKHTNRYNILKSFFENFNLEVSSYNFGSHYPKGYCGVIELLLKIKTDKKGLKEVCFEVVNTSDEKVFKWFFDGLRLELKYVSEI
jgi:HD superfamily phosphodiesterase